jgi:hypothetical protein
VRCNPTERPLRGPPRVAHWDNAIRFSLPTSDVFRIDADGRSAAPAPGPGPDPFQGQPFAGVGTILFNMAVNPVSGHVYVTNGEARNEVRFEGVGGWRAPCAGTCTRRASRPRSGGRQRDARHLNKHIDYDIRTEPDPGTSAKSLATPMGMAVSRTARRSTSAAFGSSKVGVFDVAALENDTFVPNAADHVVVSGGGPSGLVLDEPRHRLYVLTRFDDAVSVIDTTDRTGDAAPPALQPRAAERSRRTALPVRRDLTSSNGEAACASCHIFGDFDSLAVGPRQPERRRAEHPNPFR